MRNIARHLIIVLILVTLIGGVTYSVFNSQGEVAGTHFSVGYADLALLRELHQPASPSNLTKSLPGPVFENLLPHDQRQLAVKLTNMGTTALEAVLEAQTFDMPSTPDLKDAIFVSVRRWSDNGNGIAEESELLPAVATKTLSQWLSSPFTLGLLTPGQVTGYLLQFSVNDIDPVYQGLSTTMDFIFNATASH